MIIYIRYYYIHLYITIYLFFFTVLVSGALYRFSDLVKDIIYHLQQVRSATDKCFSSLSLFSKQFKWFNFFCYRMEHLTFWNHLSAAISCCRFTRTLLTGSIRPSLAHVAVTSCASTLTLLCLPWRPTPGSMETPLQSYISLVKLNCRVPADEGLLHLLSHISLLWV